MQSGFGSDSGSSGLGPSVNKGDEDGEAPYPRPFAVLAAAGEFRPKPADRFIGEKPAPANACGRESVLEERAKVFAHPDAKWQREAALLAPEEARREDVRGGVGEGGFRMPPVLPESGRLAPKP